jgi:hypothetical protein
MLTLLWCGGVQAVEFAGRAARHQYVRPALEAFMHSIHSRSDTRACLEGAITMIAIERLATLCMMP